MADQQGIVARTLAGLRYAMTGNAPNEWFGPGLPITPQAPEEVRGRSHDYAVAFNMPYNPRSGEPIGFKRLKALAENCDPLRLVIERQKDRIEALDWKIKPRDDKDPAKVNDAAIKTISDFLQRPDQIHDWSQWVRAVLEQNLVIDAVSIYARPNRGGGIYALELIDGATIKPLLSQSGRRPAANLPCYQQVLKGMPAVNYTADELLCYPQNYRVDKAYGFSRVEHIIRIGDQSIARLASQLATFTHGNLSDGYFTGPLGFTPEQVRSVETSWNDLMTASVQNRRSSMFLPHGFEWNSIDKGAMSDEFDEWLIRLVCFGFGVSPTPFLKQQGLGHGSANTDKEAAEEGGVAPLMQYVQRLMNRIIADWFKRPDLEFAWVQDSGIDPKVAAEIDDKKLKNGTRVINEVRDRDGETPLPGGDVPMILNGSTWVRLEDAIKEPEPVPAPLATQAPNAADDVEVEVEDDDEEFAKAANEAAIKKLKAKIATYLAAKADAIADPLAEKLGMAKSMDDFSARIDAAFEEVDWTWSDLVPDVQPLIAGIATSAGRNAVSQLGLFDAATLKRVSANAVAWAADRAASLVGMRWVAGQLIDNPNAKYAIGRATRDMLRALITTAMEEGSSTANLATAIRDAVAFSPDRAETVARTESAIADVQGQIVGWKATEVVAGKQWLAAPDCCDDCQLLDGQIVALDDDFADGDPPLHPNCRCDVLPVLTEDMPDATDDDTDTN